MFVLRCECGIGCQVNLEEAREGLPEEHGEFESRVRSGFNTAYFDQQCPDQGGPDRSCRDRRTKNTPKKLDVPVFPTVKRAGRNLSELIPIIWSLQV